MFFVLVCKYMRSAPPESLRVIGCSPVLHRLRVLLLREFLLRRLRLPFTVAISRDTIRWDFYGVRVRSFILLCCHKVMVRPRIVFA